MTGGKTNESTTARNSGVYNDKVRSEGTSTSSPLIRGSVAESSLSNQVERNDLVVYRFMYHMVLIFSEDKLYSNTE